MVYFNLIGTVSNISWFKNLVLYTPNKFVINSNIIIT